MADPKDDVLATMRSRFTMAMDAYSSSREAELDDLRFMAGSPDNNWQWPADVIATRGSVQGQTINARPCLTINKLPQHVRQVTNDQRQNRPTGKVIPADDKGDIEVAQVFEGMVRHIEYISDADVAYDTACDNQVIYGEGYVRLLTDYFRDDSFDQDIRICRIMNSFSVYMDPTIQDPCGADANWCFITEDILKDEYERQFPGAAPVTSMLAQGVGDNQLSEWVDEKTVRIAEYFYYDYEKRTLNLYPDNATAFDGTMEDKFLRLQYQKPLKSRQSTRRKVMWIKTNGYERLEEREWAGKWIPVVRVVGNEFEVNGEKHISGLIRNAKDAQRMYNYWVSNEAEMLALAPKAPFVGYGGQFEGYEQKWQTANINSWPYLEVNPEVPGRPGSLQCPLPQRARPPMAQVGIMQAKLGAGDDIKSTTGQYDSSIGATSNERSGKAILAREKQGDTGTYHYIDNLSRAVRYVTRQIIDLIPKIYDTERVARIVQLDGSVDMVKINPSQTEPVKKITDPNNPKIVIDKIYNPSVGLYDVLVTTGPGYMTKRQEALDSMSMILQSHPRRLWPVIGDLFVKNMDWPGSQEMAARLAKMVDPKLMQGSDQSPEMQAADQKMQMMAQELNQMSGLLEGVKKSFEQQKIDIDGFKAAIQAYDAQTKRIAAIVPVPGALTPEETQEIAVGTIHSMQAAGDLHLPPPPQKRALNRRLLHRRQLHHHPAQKLTPVQ